MVHFSRSILGKTLAVAVMVSLFSQTVGLGQSSGCEESLAGAWTISNPQENVHYGQFVNVNGAGTAMAVNLAYDLQLIAYGSGAEINILAATCGISGGTCENPVWGQTTLECGAGGWGVVGDVTVRIIPDSEEDPAAEVGIWINAT